MAEEYYKISAMIAKHKADPTYYTQRYRMHVFEEVDY